VSTKKRQVSVRGIPADVYRLRVGAGLLGGTVFVGLLYWLINSNKLSLSGNVRKEDINGLGDKLGYTLKLLTLPLLWVLGSNLTVCFFRLTRVQAIDPLNNRDELIEVPVNIFVNSIKQFILTAFGQLSIVPILSGSDIVRIIPLVNILFVVGRIAYSLGYPKYRSFGFTLSSLPSTALITYSAWNVIRSHYL
jgi:hypothetical protein